MSNKEEQDVGTSSYEEVVNNFFVSLETEVDFRDRDDEEEEEASK